MMNALNLIVINGVTQPAEFTCTQYSGSSVIDLVIAEHDILSCVGDFQVWEDDWSVDLSDHRLVSFELDLNSSEIRNTKVSNSNGANSKSNN